jgi:hypothetical protein
VVISALAVAAAFEYRHHRALQLRLAMPDRNPPPAASTRQGPLASAESALQPGTNAPPAVYQDEPVVAEPRRSPWPSSPRVARPPSGIPRVRAEEVPASREPPAADVQLVPKPQPAPAPSMVPAPIPVPAAAAAERNVTVEITLDSRVPFGLKRITSHIPLLGHLRPFRSEGGDSFTPARPAASIRPRLPASIALNLLEETSVDVAVSIDKHGTVKKTEVIGGAGTGLDKLAVGTVASAPWEPARFGDRVIATEMVIHYRFSPLQSALSTSNPR